jgi:hypothetical protein
VSLDVGRYSSRIQIGPPPPAVSSIRDQDDIPAAAGVRSKRLQTVLAIGRECAGDDAGRLASRPLPSHRGGSIGHHDDSIHSLLAVQIWPSGD